MRKLNVIAAIAAMSSCVFAGVLSPDWVGSSYTVHAQWDSWNVVSEAYIPDVWNAANPAELTLSDAPDALAYEGVTYAASYGGRSNVLLLSGLGYYNMDFFMPDYGVDETTQIRVQVTYLASGYNPLVGVDAYLNNTLIVSGIAGPYSEGTETLENGWITEAYTFVVTPNAGYEFITLGFSYSGTDEIAVDSVVIDSIAVPEPATLFILGLGGLFGIRRRR